MSKIFKEGLNWVIIDHIGNLDLPKKVLETVTENDWSDYTSAKGPKSKQHYIINPRWMPAPDHKQPDGWPELCDKFKSIVQKEVVYHGLMPMDWGELHAVSAWTVVGEEGSYHTIHEHGPMNICSVTYLKVPEHQEYPQGQIYFVMHSDGYTGLSTPSSRVLHVQPQEGMIVIFPSWMLHGVYPQGKGTRQTLNIDFSNNPNYDYSIEQAGTASYG